MGNRPTTYFNNYGCRPTYAWIPPATSGSTSSGSSAVDDFTNFIAGETILARDAVFIKTDGKVYRTIALSISASFDIGFAISGAIADALIPVDTRHGKVLNYFSGLSPGIRYFLSESYGAITIAIPQNKDSMVYQAGIAKSATELLFDPHLHVLK